MWSLGLDKMTDETFTYTNLLKRIKEPSRTHAHFSSERRTCRGGTEVETIWHQSLHHPIIREACKTIPPNRFELRISSRIQLYQYGDSVKNAFIIAKNYCRSCHEKSNDFIRVNAFVWCLKLSHKFKLLSEAKRYVDYTDTNAPLVHYVRPSFKSTDFLFHIYLQFVLK